MDASYIQHIQGRVSLEPTLVDLPRRHMVGIATRFQSMEVERNRLAHRLQPLWDGFVPQMTCVESPRQGVGYGVICTDRPDGLTYLAAVEASSELRVVPEGMEQVTLPACTWAVFEHHGATEQLDHTVNYVYACWLLQSGRAHAYLPDLEIYDERYAPGSPESVVGYAIPVV